MRRFLTAALLVCLAGPASAAENVVNWGLTTGAQPRSVCAYDTGHQCVPTGLLNATTHKSSPLFPIDLRVYGAVCNGASSTGVAAAVAAAVSAGAKAVFLPKNCRYVPTANTTPDGLTIIGEDWASSTIAVANRATDYLGIGGHAQWYNVDTISKFCDDQAAPQLTQKDCPVGHAANSADAAAIEENWAFQTEFFSSGTTTTPSGSTSTDVPVLGIVSNTGGDAIFTATSSTDSAGGVGHRFQVGGDGDLGILIQNGLVNPTNAHFGMRIVETGTSTSSHSFAVDRRTSGPIGVFITDDSAVVPITAGPPLAINIHELSGVAVMNVFHSVNAYNSAVINLNMGNAGGTFGGSFISAQNGGVTKFLVDSTGAITAAGGLTLLPQAPPASPASGWTFYTDSGDSNKLKAKASTGTIVTLGTP